MNSLTTVSQFSAWKPWRVLAVGVGVLSLTLATPVFAQEKALRTLTVTGRGTEMIPATLANVRLGVEAQGKTAKEVQAEVARRSNSVVSLLKSRNVDKLQTTGINLNPTYRYDNNVQTLTGYTASNIVSFRVEAQKAGALLDDAVQAGASRIDGISFNATEGAIASAQKVALGEATQDAQTQADAVLSSLGLSRKEVVGIQVNGAFAPPPRPLFKGADVLESRAAAAPPTPVEGGEQQVEASVTLQISY
ncbi:MAG: SIMPL domain-containing protein [Leptolyngbyaceae cyanobacterium RU_5_1]|nr:SIMPL domain-containing protein [Leptolyngbyaceae cyanobacterium RU_5_1]